MFPALRKVNNADAFFDILFNAVKGYCIVPYNKISLTTLENQRTLA
jgi:hypothetical protein